MYETWPSLEEMNHIAHTMPLSMYPNEDPLAVILEGYLSMSECDAIVAAASSISPHNFPGCNSSRVNDFEDNMPDDVFKSAIEIVKGVNLRNWGFDIFELPHAWMQTYEAGAYYDLHSDSAPGQSRKLSAVIQLTGKGLYTGGDLELLANGQILRAPRIGGSIIIFQSWIQHRVTPVTSGMRQTINLGFYGPKLR